jgi:integrase
MGRSALAAAGVAALAQGGAAMTGAVDAATALEVLRRAVAAGTELGGPTIGDLFERYRLAEQGKLRSWPAVEARWAYLRPVFADRPALGLNPIDVDAYREVRRASTTRRGKAPAPGTRNREVAILRRLLNFAVDNRLLPFNPLARLRLEAERNLRQTVLGEPELRRLLAACRPALLRAIVLVLADTGARRMEILGLRHDQVDLRTGVITIPADLTKTGRPRKIRLTRRALAAVKGLPRRAPSPFVFTAPTGRPWNPRYVYRLYQRAVAAAGLEGVAGEPVVLHTLRHSFVAKARRRGISERVVMGITGHRSRSAFDRYGAIDDSELAAAARRIEGSQGRRRP